MKIKKSCSNFVVLFFLPLLFFLATEISLAQYTIQAVVFALNDAASALLLCSPATYSNCIDADRLLDRADVAIDQILRERTKRGCIDGSLANLENQSIRLANLDAQLEAASGMRRTYENTLVKVRSWQNTRQCTAPQDPFRITGVVHKSQVVAGAGGDSLAVHWQGNPKFPVRMNYYNVGACPTYYSCTNPSKTFTYSANPLIFNGALWCTRVSQPGSYYFNYAVKLVDAAGNTTQQEKASFTCINQ